jgi:hypothetical protein
MSRIKNGRLSAIRKQQMRAKAREIREQRVAAGLAKPSRIAPGYNFQIGEIAGALECEPWDRLRVAVYAYAVVDVLRDKENPQALGQLRNALLLPQSCDRLLGAARRRVMEAA